jgi:radical SAM/Cys-rich protein
MLDTAPLLTSSDFPSLKRDQLSTLQLNLGYRCNQSCLHCHVNAGPSRSEQMARETIDIALELLQTNGIKTLDLTGGAPELNPDFRYIVGAARGLGVRVIDRCNLTILNEPGMEDLAAFLASEGVEVVASMPCYLEENIDAQRGDGVYRSSIEALQKLNALGYGQEGSGLVLNLMYNPAGPSLPPSQEGLQADYKRELQQRAGIVFNQLYVLVNMPIKRFGSSLISHGKFEEYMTLLKDSFQPANLATPMCRSLISVDWQGRLYDCDFNQMLDLPMHFSDNSRPHISDLLGRDLQGVPIVVADHCYGCTAGQGSSCSGALGG